MFKIINLYITKIFIYRFIITFIIIFFLFIIEFFWSKLDYIIEKGVHYYNIIKLLFYFGISVIPLIIPLSILLTCVMVYGEFSEKNEILAIKNIGLSIYKILKPIISIILILSIIVYLFSEYIIPISQNKIRNIVYDMIISDSYINIKTGIFIQKIPNMIIKIDKKINGYNNYFEGIYIKWRLTNNKTVQRTIIAKKGIIDVYSNSKLLILSLYNGIIYEEYIDFLYKKNKFNYRYNIIDFKFFLQKLKKQKLIYKLNYISNYTMLNYSNLLKKIQKLKYQINIINKKLKYPKYFVEKKNII